MVGHGDSWRYAEFLEGASTPKVVRWSRHPHYFEDAVGLGAAYLPAASSRAGWAVSARARPILLASGLDST